MRRYTSSKSVQSKLSEASSERDRKQSKKIIIHPPRLNVELYIINDHTRYFLHKGVFPIYKRIIYFKRALQGCLNIAINSISAIVDNEFVENTKKIIDFPYNKCLQIEFLFNRYLCPKELSEARTKIIIHLHKKRPVEKRIIVEISPEKAMEVSIVDKTVMKPNLGGFKDINTDIEYHHAYSQTGPPPPKIEPEQLRTRDVQTEFMRNRKVVQKYSRAQQTCTKSLWMHSDSDQLKNSLPYVTSAVYRKLLNIEGKVMFIQKCYHAHIIRIKLFEQSVEYHKRRTLEQRRRCEEKKEIMARKCTLLIKISTPINHGDYAILYSLVNKWKEAETNYINRHYCGPAKIVQLKALLEKELEILSRMKTLENNHMEDATTMTYLKFFRTIGEPIKWYSRKNGLPHTLDTLQTQAARRYIGLITKVIGIDKVSKEEKLLIYKEVLDYLRNHYCEDAMDLRIRLNRVCVMISRDMPKDSYLIEQKIIEEYLVNHLKNYSCNEGITYRMDKLAENRWRHNLYSCISCHKLVTMDECAITGKSLKPKFCKVCHRYNMSEPKGDMCPYQFMLQDIRKYEKLHFGKSIMAYILRDKDIQYIVDKIWNGHSSVSEEKDLYNLKLVRFYRDQDWSPWNCILLTHKEARAHLKIVDLKTVYDEQFLNNVMSKHCLAKYYYKHILLINERFFEKVAINPRLDGEMEYYEFERISPGIQLLYQCH